MNTKYAILIQIFVLLVSSCITDSEEKKNKEQSLSSCEAQSVFSSVSESSSSIHALSSNPSSSSLASLTSSTLTSSSNVSISVPSLSSQTPLSSAAVSSSGNGGSLSSLAQLSSSAQVIPKVQVRMSRYEWSGMDVFSIILVKKTSADPTDMVLHWYFKDKPGLDSALGFRLDIGQVWSVNGFSQPFFPTEISNLTLSLRQAFPQPLDTVNGVTSYCWMVDLSSISFQDRVQIRLDLSVDHRSPYPPFMDLLNENPGIDLGADDYSFKDIPFIAKDAGDLNPDTIPENPNVLLMSGENWLWGSSPN